MPARLPHSHPSAACSWSARTACAMRSATTCATQQLLPRAPAGRHSFAKQHSAAIAALRIVGLWGRGKRQLGGRQLSSSPERWCSVCRQRLPCSGQDCRSPCSLRCRGLTIVSDGGGGGMGPGDGGHGGDGGGSGGAFDAAAAAVAVGQLGHQGHSEDVILLDVSGMKCAGCVSRVKGLLEGQPPVVGASVNLATETAMVRVSLPPAPTPTPGPAANANGKTTSATPPPGRVETQRPGGGAWGEQRDLEQGLEPPSALEALGEALAKMLTAHGFRTTLRDRAGGSGAAGKVVAAKRAERLARLREATTRLALAWVLASACLVHHAVHLMGPAAPGWLHMLCATPVQAALSAFALLGPGRRIMADGLRALAEGAPDMNSLVSLGAGASFGISALAALAPQLGWRTFFEEPAMLLGVVLVGRALEERAKLQASADMAALQGLLPPKARLLLGDGSWREVPSESVAAGDMITVLPGDRVPVDGEVVGGRSTLDESALTGEALPVTKVQGDRVTAGTMNYDGQLAVRAVHSGGDTAVADIVRLVESAQARTAPVQRLADRVAGKFTYGVMAAAAATFLFWAGVGTKVFPQVLAPYAATASRAGASLLLSLQLACNVLVVACPCALGLAAPTAVLVGTGAGARRGLLIRGGDILEAASHVDTVVFDKTGTLTSGKPTVVAVRPLTLSAAEHQPEQQGQQQQHGSWQQQHSRHTHSSSRSSSSGGVPAAYGASELLGLAAAVERGSTHPIAKAILKAADAATVQQQQQKEGPGTNGAKSHGSFAAAVPGSFVQEPGSGVTATVGGRRVSVGTLEWVTRQQQEQQQQQQQQEAQRLAEESQTQLRSDAPQGMDLAAAAAAAPGTQGQLRLPTGALSAGDLIPGHILVYVGIDGALAGTIEVADELRPDAAATVAALQRMGVEPIMLSGDQRPTALAMAAAVGIPPEDVYAEVKPAGKAAAVAALQQRGRRVAMVGDGVNDAAALAQADVGIAMGGGVDAASEVADIVLLGDRVPQVLDALQLSRATLRKIKQNMWWAFGYNLLGLPLAAGALVPLTGLALTPSISGAMMGFSSLAVMANSLTLQFEGRGVVGLGGASISPGSAATKQQKPQQKQGQLRTSDGEGPKEGSQPSLAPAALK